jgi:putative holliday junction resolvase
MRVLGVDYGAKRVGVALGDTETRVASAWEVLPHGGDLHDLAARVASIATREDVKQVVVGIPRPLKQASMENAQVREIRGFIMALRDAGLTVVEWDESLTSKVAAQHEQALRPLTAAGRQKSGGAKRDDLAAAAMLEGWLERV